MEENKKKRTYTPDQSFVKICRWCAFQERSQQEVRDKLYEYGLHQNDVEQIISRVITEGFLNEERFAIAFAGGKFRQLGWGKEKIKIALKQKRVSDYCIKKALSQINDNDYFNMMKKVLKKREPEEKERDLFKRNYKLANYLVSRGFESDLVWSLIKDADFAD